MENENLTSVITFNDKKKQNVPIWEKFALTVEETAIYSNIGENTLRELIKDLTNTGNCNFLLCIGNKKLIKRKQFEDYINKIGVI
ncbi:excisionase [Sinanaerobacter chloroacetimidivorans]|uniref:Transposase n=1 Tax=Sinanaerobacter chloroacetimidivorans TaxID=2818044 RepID=A0A8J7W4I9_9FIRM|nr:excisionase [Sinanaerobacter chloroacetimidivorans]MBR0599055.1 transposase [Sinanaerobacter chloroacetimidivorans]